MPTGLFRKIYVRGTQTFPESIIKKFQRLLGSTNPFFPALLAPTGGPRLSTGNPLAVRNPHFEYPWSMLNVAMIKMNNFFKGILMPIDHWWRYISGSSKFKHENRKQVHNMYLRLKSDMVLQFMNTVFPLIRSNFQMSTSIRNLECRD